LGSSASLEEGGGTTDTATTEIEGGATKASTTASVDAVDTAARVSDRSLVVGPGARLAGGIEEEEAMDKVKNKKKKKKKKKKKGKRGNR
jgi:hypothetical protein